MQLMESVVLLFAVAMVTGINSHPCQWSMPGWLPKEGDGDGDGDGYLVKLFIAPELI